MRVWAMILCLVLPLAACAQPAGSVGAPGMRIQLADDLNKIPAAGPVNPDPRVGAIFLGDGNLHTCTGSVVHSSSGDLILTAAHCLVKGVKTTFVPGFANSAAPSNIWTIAAAYLDPLWVTFKDPASTTHLRESAAPAADRSRHRSAPRCCWAQRLHRAPKSASSATRPVSGARRSVAKAGRGSA